MTAIELLAILLMGVLKDRITKKEINKICNTFFFVLKTFLRIKESAEKSSLNFLQSSNTRIPDYWSEALLEPE